MENDNLNVLDRRKRIRKTNLPAFKNKLIWLKNLKN